MQTLVKSPLNYIGNKYRLLPQLLKIFPKDINNFIDIFTGGADVAANIQANNIIANDINIPVIEILQEFQKYDVDYIINFIDSKIQEFNLNKTNEEGYLKYRDLYNKGIYNTPLDLFTLSRFSYNQIIRFNNKGEYNGAFGRNRANFNDNMRNNTIAFIPKIKQINFTTLHFRKFDLSQLNNDKDFIYIDPPYLVARADYNIGRVKYLSWTEFDELELYKYLDNTKIRWAFSNFIKHKNKVNTLLENWAYDNKYNIYHIKSDYLKITTKAERIYDPTIEVVITNY